MTETMQSRVLAIHKYDVQNGPGIRLSIWLAGCSNACKGCWSPHTWDPNKGDLLTDKLPYIESLLKSYKSTTVKVSILGGDPFYHAWNGHVQASEEVLELFKLINKYTTDVWVWTGYLLEDLQQNELCRPYLDYIGTLVDGRFEESQKDLNLKFRGSANQRILKLK